MIKRAGTRLAAARFLPQESLPLSVRRLLIGRACALALLLTAVGVLGLDRLFPGSISSTVPVSPPVTDPTPPGTVYDTTPKRLPLLAAHTVVDRGPPEGWSHLILKSYPRPDAGDAEKLNPRVRELAGLYFTA